LNRAKRVEIEQKSGPWQSVFITVVNKSEIDTAAFREFVEQAGESFRSQIGKLQTSVEDLMPWKQNGEKWHASDKGFPPGKGRKWDTNLLPAIFKVIQKVAPDAAITWDVRDAVTVRLPGITRMWCRLKTKESKELEVWFSGKPGQFNLGRVEQFGRGAEIVADRADGVDVIKLKFATADQLKANELAKFLNEQVKGFRESLSPVS